MVEKRPETFQMQKYFGNYRAFGVRISAAAKVCWGRGCQEANYEGFVSGCSSLGIALT